MDCSRWNSRDRILEWVAIPFSRGSSQPRDWTQVSRIEGRFFTSWATREATKQQSKMCENQVWPTKWSKVYNNLNRMQSHKENKQKINRFVLGPLNVRDRQFFIPESSLYYKQQDNKPQFQSQIKSKQWSLSPDSKLLGERFWLTQLSELRRQEWLQPWSNKLSTWEGPPHWNQTVRLGDIPVVDVPMDIPEKSDWLDSPRRILYYSQVK